MQAHPDLLRATRWPLVVLAVAGVLIVVAALLDQTSATGRDYALLIGAPALTVLLPVGAVWLVVALVLHTSRRSGSAH